MRYERLSLRQLLFYFMRIVFLGTPDFAVASLEALHKAGYEIVGVVTSPDKPAGRGMELHSSPVKLKAIELGLKVLQPEKLKDPNFLNELTQLKADLQVVVAFRMLPEVVWNMPPMGTINVHASLLPQYRGAAPINWAIMNGERETGVTTFKLKHEIDTGNILMQRKLSIGDQENVGSLYTRLMIAGAELLVETIQSLNSGLLGESEQQIPTGVLHHAPKIYKDTCLIHWKNTSIHIVNQIRGLSPYPGAYAVLQGKMFKIFSAVLMNDDKQLPVGSVQTDGKTFMHVSCGSQQIKLLEVQLEGKKRMMIEDFLRGVKLPENMQIGV